MHLADIIKVNERYENEITSCENRLQNAEKY